MDPMDLQAKSLQLFMSPVYWDLEITCGDKSKAFVKSWKCHRAILCTRNTFFEKICGSGFAETGNRRIELPDDDPEAVDMLLLYLYTLEDPAYDCFEQAAKAAVIANKYDAGRMELTAAVYMCNALTQKISDWVTLSTAERQECLSDAEKYGYLNAGCETLNTTFARAFAEVSHHLSTAELEQLSSVDISLSSYFVAELVAKFRDQEIEHNSLQDCYNDLRADYAQLREQVPELAKPYLPLKPKWDRDPKEKHALLRLLEMTFQRISALKKRNAPAKW